MLSLYNAVLLPLRAATTLWAAWDGRLPGRADEWAERRALRLPEVRGGGVWIHGASVGEARIVHQLARELRRRAPGLVISASCVTRTGRAQLPVPPEVDAAFFAPLDFRGLPGRLLDALRPAVLVLVETELWPNTLREARARAVPVVVVNGRLAPERMARYRRLARLYRPLLASLARIGAQTDDERRRFEAAGARPGAVTVTGNVKYDLPGPGATAAALRARLGLSAERPVVVAGSTGAGEEDLVFEAFQAARARVPGLFLVLAPRHPERSDAVARQAAARGLAAARLSATGAGDAGRGDALLVDRVGELAALYVLGEASFVGGSLVPLGGHNLLEPAAAGSPVLHGPYVHHVEAVAAALTAAGGARRVDDAASLGRAIVELHLDPELRRRMTAAAAGVVRAHAGALARTAELVLAAAGSAP
jgi:3-deoxy-D-manno-octulosonic-acid transferase